MRILIFYISISFLLFACKDVSLEENDEFDETFQTELREEELSEGEGNLILDKNVPSELFTDYDVKLVLPFYYNRINIYEDEEMDEKWWWDQFAQNQLDSLNGTEISFDSYLNWGRYIFEDAVLIPFENDTMISVEGIKEDVLSEGDVVFYEDENSIIYGYSNSQAIIKYFEYSPVSKTYLLYMAHFDFDDNSSSAENIDLAFELLRNAKNLQNYASLENDFSSFTWPDYAKAQPKILTHDFVAKFNNLKKQINIFMDPGERISVPNDGSHTYLEVMRTTDDEDYKIVDFLHDIEKGDQKKILESGNALKNNAHNFLGMSFNKDQTSFKTEKKGSAQIITITFTNTDKYIETQYYVIGNLIKGLDSFYFRSWDSIRSRSYFYASLIDYYIKNGTLQISENN